MYSLYKLGFLPLIDKFIKRSASQNNEFEPLIIIVDSTVVIITVKLWLIDQRIYKLFLK